jgi:hypothetical protein
MGDVRILIYTDYDGINENSDPHGWGITELRKLIRFKSTNFMNFKFDWIYRFASKTDPTRLTGRLLCQYDQLWVFGVIHLAKDPYRLNAEEVEALGNWMDGGGGLLFAGDHAVGSCRDGKPETFSVHGRALGEQMKRAGSLRVWEGPPTACVDRNLSERDNYNTCEGDDPERLDDSTFESDSLASELIHERSALHKLFWFGKSAAAGVSPIERFPDHQHESKLHLPSEYGSEWPLAARPVVVAKVRDKRFPNEDRIYPVVIAYDGDMADVGRIVADSSFHHYINSNLVRIPERNAAGFPVAKSHLDQMAQYYLNLAIWLIPKTLRQTLKLQMFFDIASHPDVFEVRGTGSRVLGAVGRNVLMRKFGEENLYQFVEVDSDTKDRGVDHLVEAILLPTSSIIGLSEDQRTLLLGSIIETYHQFFQDQGAITPDWIKFEPNHLDILKTGLKSSGASIPSIGEKLESMLEMASKESILD